MTNNPEKIKKLFIEVAKGRTLKNIEAQYGYGYSPSSICTMLQRFKQKITTTLPELKDLEHDYSTIVGHIRRNKDRYLKALL